MFMFATKAALISLMGEKFCDDKEAKAFMDCYSGTAYRDLNHVPSQNFFLQSSVQVTRGGPHTDIVHNLH
jgi:hypothetical protein